MLVLAPWPQAAFGHGSDPEVVGLTLSSAQPGVVHALTNNQGVFANLAGQYRWVCEDAVYPFAKTQGLVLSGEDEQRWIVATNHGVHISTDGGCDFEAVEHALGETRVGGAWRHPETRDILTVETEADGPNNVYFSSDEGATWSMLAGPVQGVFRSFHWVPAPGATFIIRTDSNLQRSVAGSEEFVSIAIRVGDLEIPVERIHNLAVSPVQGGVMVVAVTSGERARILRSEDGGDTWTDRALLPEPAVSLLFDAAGREILAAGALGGRWRSVDGGLSFTDDGVGPAGLNCLMRGSQGEILGCSNPNSDGPWVIGRSDDFGRSWDAVLERFEDTVHRKDCGRTDRAYLCCRGRCPGNAMMCGQPTGVDWPPECYEGVDPSLLPDGGLNGPGDADSGPLSRDPVSIDGTLMGSSVDGGSPVGDGGVTPTRGDSGAGHARSQESAGCSTHRRGDAPTFIILLGALYLYTRRR